MRGWAKLCLCCSLVVGFSGAVLEPISLDQADVLSLYTASEGQHTNENTFDLVRLLERLKPDMGEILGSYAEPYLPTVMQQLAVVIQTCQRSSPLGRRAGNCGAELENTRLLVCEDQSTKGNVSNSNVIKDISTEVHSIDITAPSMDEDERIRTKFQQASSFDAVALANSLLTMSKTELGSSQSDTYFADTEDLASRSALKVLACALNHGCCTSDLKSLKKLLCKTADDSIDGLEFGEGCGHVSASKTGTKTVIAMNGNKSGGNTTNSTVITHTAQASKPVASKSSVSPTNCSQGEYISSVGTEDQCVTACPPDEAPNHLRECTPFVCASDFMQIARQKITLTTTHSSLPDGVAIDLQVLDCACTNACACTKDKRANVGFTSDFRAATRVSNTSASSKDVGLAVLDVVNEEYVRYQQKRDKRALEFATQCLQQSALSYTAVPEQSESNQSQAEERDAIGTQEDINKIKEDLLAGLKAAQATGHIRAFKHTANTTTAIGIQCGSSTVEQIHVLGPNETCSEAGLDEPVEKLCAPLANTVPLAKLFLVWQVGCLHSAVCIAVKTTISNSTIVSGTVDISGLGTHGKEVVNQMITERDRIFCEGRCGSCVGTHIPCECAGSNTSQSNYCEDLSRAPARRSCEHVTGATPSGCDDSETMVQTKDGEWVRAAADEVCCAASTPFELMSLDTMIHEKTTQQREQHRDAVMLDITGADTATEVVFEAPSGKAGCKVCKHVSRMACNARSYSTQSNHKQCSFQTGCEPKTFSTLAEFSNVILRAPSEHVWQNCGRAPLVIGTQERCSDVAKQVDTIARTAVANIRFKVARKQLT
jgi:hypothetical protein